MRPLEQALREGVAALELTLDDAQITQLLDYLAAHRDVVWTDTFINIMKYVKSTRLEPTGSETNTD